MRGKGAKEDWVNGSSSPVAQPIDGLGNRRSEHASSFSSHQRWQKAFLTMYLNARPPNLYDFIGKLNFVRRLL